MAASQDELLAALLEPDDDRAWKIAVGQTLHDVKEQAKATNGRVRALETWRAYLAGAVAVLTLGMPFILWLLTEARS